MPDFMDAVQDRVLAETEALLQERPAAAAGRSHCADEDCGETISPERTALGAQLCLDCQRAAEAREAHFRTWSRR